MQFILKKDAPEIAKRFFSFNPKDHPDLWNLPLGSHFKERISGSGKYSIMETEPQLVKQIAGLYWMEWCLAAGKFGEKGSPRRGRVEKTFDKYLFGTAEMMGDYLLAICAGELRHCQFRSSSAFVQCKVCVDIKKKLAEKSDGMSRINGSKLFWDYVKKSNTPTYGHLVEVLLHGFCDHTWPNGFGGRKWGYITFEAMKLLCAFHEGDRTEAMKHLDFIIHAVHNGCNCLADKFEFYQTGYAKINKILNAKFHGEDCCWLSIQDYIPDAYKLIKTSACFESVSKKVIRPSCGVDECIDCSKTYQEVKNPCEHKLPSGRDADTIGQEEKLFCEFFREAEVCEVCGEEIKKVAGCDNYCYSCQKHFDMANPPLTHAHFCSCGGLKKGANVESFFCPNGCETCWKMYIAYADKEFDNKKGLEFAKENEQYKKWLDYYKGCISYPVNHAFCHDCGAFVEGKIRYGTVAKKIHPMCQIHWIRYCPKKDGGCKACTLGASISGEISSSTLYSFTTTTTSTTDIKIEFDNPDKVA